jgi:hypothetical protein
MTIRRRKVEFEANLLFVDEPLIVLFKSKNTFLIAVAIDQNDLPGSDFVCFSLTQRNWDKYIDGHVDLRFLFTYPATSIRYNFAYSAWTGNTVTLTPFDGIFADELLPSKGLFSREHTNSYGKVRQPSQTEELFIDGEWELNEFGKFYQKYSDLYAVTAALKNIDNLAIPQALRGRTENAFRDRPFKGGSSYLHVFDDLPACLPRDQRIALDGINYNSPGDVRILGEMTHFSEIELLIRNFMTHRDVAVKGYRALYQTLSRQKLLTASANSFSLTDPRGNQILSLAQSLADSIKFSEMDALKKTCDNNSLVTAKIVLAIYRRLEAAALFFAEGRMSFDRN